MTFIQYEVVDHVGVITLDRAEKANAQTTALLRELNDRWIDAAFDTEVRVILVQANGRHFSAGMDLTTPLTSAPAGVDPASHYNPQSLLFFGNALAWRSVPKPSIAAVQGKCIAAGLMLCWPCDLIIAAEDATFSDPTLRMGMAGVQYMAHVWELGPRKAKEMLLRSTPIDAAEALGLGMVNRVVPLPELRAEAMAWARDIATLDPGAAAMVKRAINGAVDTQGFAASIANGFDLQELGSAYRALRDAGGDGRARGAADAPAGSYQASVKSFTDRRPGG
jgi:enoyl-CoA hydratase